MSDPREIIDNSPMTALQWVVVILTVLMNAMDGFDVLAISVAGPGIMSEFGIDRAALGWVLSMELIGMAVGSVLLGGVADTIGRRKMTLGCLSVMAIGMYLASTSTSVVILSVWRVITGLGIGGMLSTVNATTAEFSNSKNRGLCIALMVIGYPIGGIICGQFGRAMLDAGAENWRVMFTGGAVFSAALIPLAYFLVPESVHWLARKQPAGALERVNQSLAKLKLPSVSSIPELAEATRKKSVFDIFSPTLVATTILVTASYFLTITAFYFLVKWTPTIVTLMNFEASAASGILAWISMGGAVGGAVFGVLTVVFGLKRLTIIIMVLSMIAIALFGRSEEDLTQLGYLAAVAGFFTNAAISGLYAIVAKVFPTHVRATGTGFVIGVGRLGSVAGPVIAGYLFQSGFELPMVALLVGICTLLAAVLIFFVKVQDGDLAEVEEAQRSA